jgi:elongation factor G
VPIQFPIGQEDAFKGVVDLVEMRAYFFDEDDAMGAPTEVPIPADIESQVATYREQMIERVAEQDDQLMEKFLEGTAPTIEELKAGMRRATVANKLVLLLCGSALKSKGIQFMLDAVLDYLPSPLDVPAIIGVHPQTGETVERPVGADAPFSALAFKIMTDPYVGRLVYFRVYSGTAYAGTGVYNATKGVRERLGRIVLMHAQHREEMQSISVGEIGAAVGLKNTFTGETICDERNPVVLEAIRFADPVISMAIEPKTKAEQDKLTDALIKLAEEDPTFRVRHDAETGQTIISGMGELHLEILVDRIKREFSVQANTGKPQVAYREAVTRTARAEGRYVRQTGGRGQYGHCVLEVTPGENGTGFIFENKIVGGSIPKEFISPIQQGAREALQVGVIGGYPVLDVKVTLLDGTFHAVDSSEMAFKIAGSMALKSALSKAGSVLLEPMMELQVVTPREFLGPLLDDLSRRRGKIKSMEGEGAIQSIEADIPLVEMFGYATSLRSLSQGRATHSMEFGRYEQVAAHMVEELVKSA